LKSFSSSRVYQDRLWVPLLAPFFWLSLGKLCQFVGSVVVVATIIVAAFWGLILWGWKQQPADCNLQPATCSAHFAWPITVLSPADSSPSCLFLRLELLLSFRPRCVLSPPEISLFPLAGVALQWPVGQVDCTCLLPFCG